MPALHIGVQAVLALYASWAAAEHKDQVGATSRGVPVLFGGLAAAGNAAWPRAQSSCWWPLLQPTAFLGSWPPPLASSNTSLLPHQERGGLLTGVVVDSGDGCTHCIPVVDGFVLSSSIRSVPLAGRDVTQHVQQLLRCVEGGAQGGLEALGRVGWL